ncbi:MAG TPA: hypothetical protein VND64_02660 [Pirellulales bacterium]|nr:hypothetical protein [Pirellulales bacterium]
MPPAHRYRMIAIFAVTNVLALVCLVCVVNWPVPPRGMIVVFVALCLYSSMGSLYYWNQPYCLGNATPKNTGHDRQAP